MPNWVSNQLKITGPKEELDRFQQQAGQAYTTKKQNFSDKGIEWEDETYQEPLSFWNFIKPDEAIMEEYFGPQPQGQSFAEAIQHKTNHWYDWNVRTWGCKWDASYVQCDRDSDTKLVYSFETPWSAPEPVFQEMVASFPKLDFEYRYLEEQGWGGEVHGSGGLYWIVDEWDIPNSHAERIDKIGYCQCQEYGEHDDIEYLDDDCPLKMEKLGLTASK